MPRVPVQEVPGVASAPLNPRMQAPLPSAGLGQIGQGLGELGQGLGIAAQARQQAGEADVAKLESQLEDAKTDLYYNAQSGAFHQAGEDGFKAADSALSQLQKARDDLLATSTSPYVQAKFLERSDLMLEKTRRDGEQFKAIQRQAISLAAVDDAQKASLRALANSWSDPSERERLIANGLDAIEAAGITKDNPSREAIDGAKAAWTQQAYAESIRAALAQAETNPGAVGQAKEIYAAHRADLGTAGPELEKALAEAGVAQTGVMLGDRIAAAAVKDGEVDYTKVDEMLTAIPDAKVRQATRQIALEHAQLRSEGFKQQVDSVYGGLLKTWEQTGRRSALDPTAITQLQGMGKPGADAWETLKRIMHEDVTRSQSGPLSPDQQMAITKFEVDLVDHPESYATLTPEAIDRRVLANLPRQYQARGRELVVQLRENAGKSKPLPPSDEHLLLAMGRDAGVFPDASAGGVDKWEPEKVELWTAANGRIQARIADYQRINGKPPDASVRQQWIAEELLKGSTPSGHWYSPDPSTTPLQLSLEGRGLDQFQPAWTEEQKARAAAAVAAAGGKPTAQAVERYLRLKNELPAPPASAEPPPEENYPSPRGHGNL